MSDAVRLSPKLRRRLESIRLASDRQHGMYQGDYWDAAPRQHQVLQGLGFVDSYQPHNPAHKMRVVITPAGRAALAEERAAS